MNMKRNTIIYGIVSVSISLLSSSCDKFLDKMPDNRAEIDTNQKLSDVLVSAYPTVDPMEIYEHRTDNVIDNGREYGSADRTIEENYFWQDISDTEWDGPEALWRSCYRSIATANQVLEEAEDIGRSSENDAQIGEALMCRAYAHFLLANTFCRPYSERTSSTDLGIPYVTAVEKKIGVTIPRGTVKSVYENIARDIEEGYKLINDGAYEIPIYHFNKKASAAFAARFYLFYAKYEQAIEYATEAIGENPSANLRNFTHYQQLPSASEWRDAYVSKNESANLLLISLRSLWGRKYNSRRYGASETIHSTQVYRSAGPWGKLLSQFDLLYGGSGYPTKYHPKYVEVFEITNQTARTGQPHVTQMAFTTDETLLVRAEAETMLKQYEKAAQDLSYFYVIKGGSAATVDQITTFYSTKRASEKEQIDKGKLPAWYVLVKPFNAVFDIEEGTQELMLQAVLHARRIETIFGGLRWLDIRRYGIEVVHHVDGGNPMTLPAGDPRRVIQIPESVVAAGMEANPK